MLRPQHHLRSPPATSPAHSAISFPRLRHRGAFRLHRAAAPTLRAAVRASASASSAPGAAPSSASSAPGATAPLGVEVEVARELASRAEARLGARLLPSAVPPDVAGFRSGGGAGNAVGLLDVRRGAPGSTIDFMLQSSLHCKVPNGAIDITSLLIFLNASTDAPHFLMKFIQGSPTSIVVLLDLLPRKDLALHPEYIERYYENTQVDKQREKIEELPQARPYRSRSLFVRSAFSLTAILMSIDCGQGGEGTLEEIRWKKARENMIKRDQIVRSKSIEVDLTSNLPRMFGPDVADRVIAEIQKAFGVQEA
uniref:Red chlorophyll catabolite reductase n=1 Tax=Oryza meridionalis TaxID=40149 RepID=A0A0E0EX86_9ORYZ